MKKSRGKLVLKRDSKLRGFGSISDDDDWDTDLEEGDEIDHRNLSVQQAYIKVCEDLNVPPVHKVLNQINTEVINLKHYGVLDKGAKAVAVAMTKNVTVATLNLHDNGIKEPGATALAKMLSVNCFVVDLDLSSNRIGRRGSKALSNMLLQNVTLTELNLSNNKLIDDDISLLCEALLTNKHIKKLNLSDNSIGDQASASIGNALQMNKVLENLDLSWNRILGKGAMELSLGAKRNQSLKELNLSWNGLSDHGAKAMRELLENNESLEVLDVTNNSIGIDGAKHLGKGLKKNRSLRTLRAGKNPFLSTGAMMILKGLLKNPESSMDNLQLENIVFDKLCEKALDDLLKQKPNFSCNWDVIVQGGQVMFLDDGEMDSLDKFIQFVRNRGLRMVDLYRAIAKGEQLKETDFVKNLKSMNIQMKDKELRELFQMLDENDDKVLSFAEFSAILNVRIKQKDTEKSKKRETLRFKV